MYIAPLAMLDHNFFRLIQSTRVETLARFVDSQDSKCNKWPGNIRIYYTFNAILYRLFHY